MESHRSLRLLLLFFPHSFLLLLNFDWVVSKFLSFSSLPFFQFFLPFALLWCRCSLLHFSFNSLNSSAPQFLFGSYYIFCVFSIYFVYVFFSWFHWIVFLSFLVISLGFFKTTILNSLSAKLQKSAIEISYWRFIVIFWWWYVSFIFLFLRNLSYFPSLRFLPCPQSWSFFLIALFTRLAFTIALGSMRPEWEEVWV